MLLSLFPSLSHSPQFLLSCPLIGCPVMSPCVGFGIPFSGFVPEISGLLQDRAERCTCGFPLWVQVCVLGIEAGTCGSPLWVQVWVLGRCSDDV
ncbi:hypothetical protein FKM82_023687 [Ascaphus truei]